MNEFKKTPAVIIMLIVAVLLMGGCASTGGNDDVDNNSAATANVNLAAEYLRRDNLDKAKEYFNKALKYDRHNQSALWGLAVTNNRIGHPDQARNYYRKALRQRHNPALLNSYAAFLCQQGQVDEAVSKFQAAANDADYNAPSVALANAGLCLHRAHDDDRAIGFLQKSLKRNASQPLALAQMARIYYERGNTMRARAYIQRADSARPLDADQLKLAARIESAAGNRQAAAGYVKRYNGLKKTTPISLGQLN